MPQVAAFSRVGSAYKAGNAMAELNTLIDRTEAGDASARDELFGILYDQLRRLAHARLVRSSRNTFLDTSALLHETYLRMADNHGLRFEDRGRYFSYASQVMRGVVVDFARARASQRRGGGLARVTLDTNVIESAAADEEQILRIHAALEELSGIDERSVRVVEMRYFGGLTEQEVATALGVSDRTVRRIWEKARYLLAAALSQDTEDNPSA
ncbi:MAG TPA: ECF-type sigma factor [Steroidobacteraceae bacterium]|jgi:RNA polymerase sigma factor (TIGR02999 family)